MIEGDEVEKEEIFQDEFLNQNEFAEIKGNYDDFGLGDLVLVFPNPDFNCPNKEVRFHEAEKIFDEVLTVMTDEGVSKTQMKKERDSFLLAFLTLNDYVPEKDEKKEKENKKKKINKSKSKVEDPEPIQEEKHRKHKEKTSYEKYLEI